MTNPFPTKKGFGLRLHYAAEALRKYGLDPSCSTYAQVANNRKFDNCFENFDGDAVVYAIMCLVHEKHDADLCRGIKLLGGTLWEDWERHYWHARNHQLPLL